MKEKKSFLARIEQLTIVQSVRGGLVNLIPVLLIGAFTLVLKTFPVSAYQNVLPTLLGGWFVRVLDLIYSATFGVLAVYMTVSISVTYMRTKAEPDIPDLGAAFSALLSFFILAGAYLPDFGLDCLGPKSMFLAILASMGSSSLYLHLTRLIRRRRRSRVMTAGADREFNRIISALVPITLVALIFAVFNALVMGIFDADCFRTWLAGIFDWMFSSGETGFIKGFFFVLTSSVLWFFGIHGSNTLESVMQTTFAPGLAANQAAVAAGGQATQVLTKEFFDCFVLMGGCGATICLLLAIVLFSRNRAHRGLGLGAAFPMLFNINEMMVFGLPIILNPVMLIPFLLVPLVCYTVAYLSISLGIVPMITGEVAWTTPVLLGGYYATGSLAGSALQLVNLALGVLIYLPFVRLLDRQSVESEKRNFAAFVDFFRENEQSLAGTALTEMDNVHGVLAKELCAVLRHDLTENLRMGYQPQYSYDGRCVGVEALLRWKHPIHGFIYPPLIVKLAEEGGFLPELEEAVLIRALAERDRVLRRFGPDVRMSVNVTGTTVVTPRYTQFCRRLDDKIGFAGKNIYIEITEQAALSFNDETLSALRELKKLGLSLAIDDFSMGQTSVNYLKESLFDALKLDGALVKGLFVHENCREIISSIVSLASTLHMSVLAEFVETEQQRSALHEIGCDLYQGYLYSPAVFLEKD